MRFSEINNSSLETSKNNGGFDVDRRAEVPEKRDAKGNEGFDIDKRAEVQSNGDYINKSNDVEYLKTVNEDLEGKTHPETGVPYARKIVEADGKKIEGVFPEFDSKFDTKLPPEMYKATDEKQFKYCTEKLAEQIKNNPELEKQFTQRQIEQIMSGDPRISGLTWHHNETPGKMQLVNAETHTASGHTGGKSIWGGGSEYR